MLIRGPCLATSVCGVPGCVVGQLCEMKWNRMLTVVHPFMQRVSSWFYGPKSFSSVTTPFDEFRSYGFNILNLSSDPVKPYSSTIAECVECFAIGLSVSISCRDKIFCLRQLSGLPKIIQRESDVSLLEVLKRPKREACHPHPLCVHAQHVFSYNSSHLQAFTLWYENDLFNSSINSSDFTVSNNGGSGWLVNDLQGRMWKDAIMSLFQVLCRNFTVGTLEKSEE